MDDHIVREDNHKRLAITKLSCLINGVAGPVRLVLVHSRHVCQGSDFELAFEKFKAKEAFDKIDVDKSGTMDEGELRQLTVRSHA